MTSPNNEQKSLTTLAQFEAALRKNLDFTILKNIVDQEFNINCQIPDTDHIRNHKPELIGSTLLHLARRSSNFAIFKYLVERGIDFTIKNGNGSTALLQPIENILGNSKSSVVKTLKDTLNNEHTELILSTHVARNISANPRDNRGVSHFHAACVLGNIAAMEFFLQNGASVDEPISTILPGYSPLHLAVISSSLQSVEVLLQRGANISVKDSRGKTPLHILIERKAVLVELNVQNYLERTDALKELAAIDEKMRLLLQNHTTLIIDDTGLSHLHAACILPSTPTFEYFASTARSVIGLAIRADSPFFPGYTALHFAVLFESPLAWLLLQRGADFAARDARGVTPFDVLLRRNDIEGIHLALSNTPSLRDVLLSDGRTRLSDLIIEMRDVNNSFHSFVKNRHFDVSARVPSDSPLFPDYGVLHLAVILHDSNFVTRTGVNYTASNLLARDSRGSTPLHLAFRRCRVRAVGWLLDRHHDNDLNDALDDDGLSILHIAVAANDARTVEKLLAISTADIDRPLPSTFKWLERGSDDEVLFINAGSTSLHIAVATENLQMIMLLLRKGANVYATDAHGLTPIHRLLVADAYKQVGDRLFSDATLQDRLVDGLNLSHLHVACFLNNVAALERFLNSGSDIEAAVRSPLPFLAHLEGFTPIHVAMREENLEALRSLLDRGADILARLPDGTTPFYWNLINRPRFFLRFYREELRKRDDLLGRVEDDIGLTMLHVAAYALDLELVADSLRRVGASVNARARLHSPIWPDCTPLCVLVARCKNVNGSEVSRVIDVARLLLDKGADVSAMDVRGDSPLHLADEMVGDADGRKNYHGSSMATSVVTEMLAHIRDFTANPKSKRGISLFHVASRVCNVAAMTKFLDKKGCDVDERIEGFFDDKFNGYTALHLSMSCSLDERKIEAVELLLNYGADCRATTVLGDAPVHTAARCNGGLLRLDLLQRLVGGGADLQARNFLGETAFELVLKSQKISAEEITFFLGSGLRANAYNSVTELGYLALAFNKKCYDTCGQEPVLDILLNNCNFHETDRGRTAIHNIVSIGQYTISQKDYVMLIYKLIKLGCELDGQDDKGRTALHSAVRFDNHQAIQALLTIGADVNILDADDQSATSYSTTNPSTLNSLALHVCKLRQLNLDVIQQNINFQERVCRENPIDERQMLPFSAELIKAESVYMGSTSISLRDLLSDTGVVAAYPTMPSINRDEINQFFETGTTFLQDQLLELQGLLWLQYRKALRRYEVIDSAKDSLQIVFVNVKGLDAEKDFTRLFVEEACYLVASRPSIILPEPCCENILRYLTNGEIDNLIASSENGKISL